jgi:small subunit ribosomal protein S6
MPVRLYETLFILDSARVSADPEAARNQVHGVLERYGAEIVVTRPWDDNRKLAYPIKKQKKGYYHTIYYRVDSRKIIEIERDFAITEIVLRLMTSVIDPKWEEVVMDVATNDQQQQFAIRGMQDENIGGDVTPNLGGMGGEMGDDMGGPPRSRGRREYADKPE